MKSTEIVFLLDRSGSMESIAGDVRGGFDAYVREQAKIPGDCRLTLIQFDSENPHEVVHENKPIGSVPPLELAPRGSTPLLDALSDAIDSTGKRLAAMDESARPERVLFCVFTDGQENASTRTTKKALSEKINHQRDTYKWEFNFMGCGIDAFAETAGTGIIAACSMSTPATPAGVRAAFLSNTIATANYRSGGSSAYARSDDDPLNKQ